MIQLDLLGNKSDVMEGFERPTYTEEGYAFASEANKKPMKDLNYFYVDFYGQEEKFTKLRDIIKKQGAISGIHRIRQDFFETLILSLEKQHEI
jgi:hypothetical protein